MYIDKRGGQRGPNAPWGPHDQVILHTVEFRNFIVFCWAETLAH